MPILYTIGRLQIAGIVFGATTWCLAFGMLLAAIHEARVRKLDGESSKGGRLLLKTLTLGEGGVERGERRSERRQGSWSNVSEGHKESSRSGERRTHRSRQGTRSEGRVQHDRERRAGAQVPFAYVKEPETSYQKSQHGKVMVHQMSAFG